MFLNPPDPHGLLVNHSLQSFEIRVNIIGKVGGRALVQGRGNLYVPLSVMITITAKASMPKAVIQSVADGILDSLKKKKEKRNEGANRE